VGNSEIVYTRGKARHGLAWQGVAGHGKAMHGAAGQGMARRGAAWLGKARQGYTKSKKRHKKPTTPLMRGLKNERFKTVLV
jgi:hypothetical protein